MTLRQNRFPISLPHMFSLLAYYTFHRLFAVLLLQFSGRGCYLMGYHTVLAVPVVRSVASGSGRY